MMTDLDSSGNTPRSRLPFVRFLLGPPRPSPRDTLPKGMERVPKQVWSDFWSKMDVVAAEVSRLDTAGHVASLALSFSMLVVIFLYIPRSSNRKVVFFLLLAASVWYILQVVYSYWKEYTWRKIEFLLREEAQTFQPYGFSLECHDEAPKDNRSKGRYLYFLPTTSMMMMSGEEERPLGSSGQLQVGYLQVRVVNDPLCGLEVSPALANYDYLPDEMASLLSQADWLDFWTEIDTVSHKAVTSIRRFCAVVIVYLIGQIIMDSSLPDVIFWINFVVVVAAMVLGCYYYGVLRAIDLQLADVCSQYMHKFQQRGIYMEFRKEYDWPCLRNPFRSVGGVIIRSIYLFPYI